MFAPIDVNNPEEEHLGLFYPTKPLLQLTNFAYNKTDSPKPYKIPRSGPVSPLKSFKKEKKGNKLKTNPIKDMSMSKANFKKEMRVSKLNQEERSRIENELPLIIAHKCQKDQQSIPSLGNFINVKNSLENNFEEETPNFEEIRDQGIDAEYKMNNDLDKINHLASTNEDENETSLDSIRSDSGYILFGDTYDIFVECCCEESLFLDIHDIKKNIQDYEIIRGNDQIMMEIEHIVLPKRNETRLGAGYQAEIPQLTRNNTDMKSLCLIWSPDAVQSEFIESYISKLSILTGVEEEDIIEERAIEVLIGNNLDLLQTLKFCYANLGYIRNRIMIKKKKMLL